MIIDTYISALIMIGGSAMIGAVSGILTVLFNQRGQNVKLQTTQDEHTRRFLGMDLKFENLAVQYVPRLEIDSRLTALKESQDRIEKSLSMVLVSLRGSSDR
jgi:hypothetical protein